MTHEELLETLAILEKLAKGFPDESPESKAIEIAAEAMLFLRSNETREKFLQHMLSRDEGLTPAQILHLRAIGIDPEQSS